MQKRLKTIKKKQNGTGELIRYAVQGIEEKKGNDVVCVDLTKIPNAACDYFLICEGSSRPQVQAIAESIEEYVEKNTGNRPWHIEGLTNAEWVLMAYVDVVVHIFQPEARVHYNLENIWADAATKKIKAAIPKLKARIKQNIPKAKKKATTKATPKKQIKRK